MTKLTIGQQDALDALKEDVIEPAEKKGWSVHGSKKGVNKKYAYVELAHDLEEFRIQAFLAVDPDSTEDKFLCGSQVITGPQAFEVLYNPGLEEGDEGFVRAPQSMDKDGEGEPVPPTSAAHSAAHQDSVPPTVKSVDAAHSKVAVPPIAANVKSANKHMRDAAQLGKKNGEDVPISQSMTQKATREHDSLDTKWSPFSELPDEVLLKKVQGKEIVWFNSFANRKEHAHVKPAQYAGNHPARITGEVEDGNDMRLLHFLETGGSFRSVAVFRLQEIL